MNPRWSRSTFSKAALLLFALAGVLGCTSSIGGGSSASSSACVGDGGLTPTPVGPQMNRTPEKFTSAAFLEDVISSRVHLVAVVNEKCVAAQPLGSSGMTQRVRDDVDAQRSLSKQRAYSMTLPRSMAKSQVQAMAEADPCLIQLSEDNEAFLHETVNDTFFNLQTHLTTIAAPTGWDTFYAGLSGNVTIAIIDDGIDLTHPDLEPILWVNPGEIAGNGVDDDGNGYVDDVNGYNFASSIASPAHQNGAIHGTHVAGLAAAIGNNGTGVSGVIGTNARIMVLNVFGTNASTGSANIVNALNYAASMGAKVINMSLGGQGTAASVGTAMSSAVAAGAFIAVSAGNSNEEVTSSNFYMPMGYAKDIDGAMSVGSIDATSEQRSSFSNYSTTYVEIAAPGSNSATGGVYSTYPPSTYQYLQGTSMSSPVLAGAAALLIEWATSNGGSPTPSQVESLLKSSSDVNGALTPYFMGGYSLNVANLAETAKCNF